MARNKNGRHKKTRSRRQRRNVRRQNKRRRKSPQAVWTNVVPLVAAFMLMPQVQNLIGVSFRNPVARGWTVSGPCWAVLDREWTVLDRAGPCWTVLDREWTVSGP